MIMMVLNFLGERDIRAIGEGVRSMTNYDHDPDVQRRNKVTFCIPFVFCNCALFLDHLAVVCSYFLTFCV